MRVARMGAARAVEIKFSVLGSLSSQLRGLPRVADLPDAVRFATAASLICYLLISMFLFRQIYGIAAAVASSIVYPTDMRKFADKGLRWPSPKQVSSLS